MENCSLNMNFKRLYLKEEENSNDDIIVTKYPCQEQKGKDLVVLELYHSTWGEKRVNIATYFYFL